MHGKDIEETLPNSLPFYSQIHFMVLSANASMLRTTTMTNHDLLRPTIFLTPTPSPSYFSICKDAMAPLLRRKLVCFYCGCRSAQKQDGRVRKWECEKCEAVNWLDEVCLHVSVLGSEHTTNGVISRTARLRILQRSRPLQMFDTSNQSLDLPRQFSPPPMSRSSVRHASKTSIS